MTENTDTKKTDSVKQDSKTLYNFTEKGIVVYADSLEEAQKLYEKKLTEDKGSDNG